MDLMGPLSWVAGSEWPNGDPGQMRQLAQLWRNAGDELRDIENDINTAKSIALSAYPQGNAYDDIASAFDSIRDDNGASFDDDKNQSLAKLAHSFDTIGDGADQVATEIEFGQWMVESSLAILGVELAIAAAQALIPLFGDAAAAAESAAEIAE